MLRFLKNIKSLPTILLLLVSCTILFMMVSTVWAEPRNVILLIGDGMGLEHVKAAGMYEYGLAGTLLFEAFPYQGQVTTYSADSSVTDSAAAATAIATHTKVNNGVISVRLPGDGSELLTLLEYFKSNGKSTGLVTTDTMTGATPAGFGAHNVSRSNTSDIASDYLNQTRPNVLFGGGSYGMSISAAQAAGYSVVTTRDSLMNLDTETATMVSGQFGSGALPYEYDGSYATLPHLTEMTASALAILDNDPDGFFLMVEGARIDHAGHESNRNRNIFETIEFDAAVQVVTEWAKVHSDTLIMVTADHETGGLTVLQNNGQGVFPTVSWSTSGHTGVNVGVYATGENAQLFTGTINNTDIYGKVTATTNDAVDYYCDGDTDGHISSSISGSCTGIGCEPYGCETTPGSDCDDGDDAIFPGAAEVVADGIDQDCNGEDRCYEDLDGDTYGSGIETDDVDGDLDCSTGANLSGNNTDCNDGDALEYPGQTWYEDVDGDLYSSGNMYVQCQRPVNHYAGSELTATTGDCDDSDINIHPGAAEVCDGVDNDCNAGTADGSGEDAPLNTLQAGVCAGSTQSCTTGTWTDDYSGVGGYEAVELTCDSLDNDCDGAVDEGLKTSYYQDFDTDNYGNGSVMQEACSQPGGYVVDNTDCDDSDINIHPGAAEVCDGVDNDCNAGTADGSGEDAPLNTLQAGVCAGSTQSCTTGTWTDDYSGVGGYEAVELTCDSLDNDCDGAVDEGLTKPIVSATVPPDNKTGVPLNSSVTINWDVTVDCTTVNTTNITSDIPGWEFSSCSGNQAVFTTGGQSGETMYTVTVTTAVTDISGCAMESNYQFSFRTNVATTLSIIEPDGSGDTVTAGDPYLITYSLTDPENVAAVAFYYDTDNTDFDGAAIAGACSAAPEGTGVTCTWDTSGMTPGVYYIYGVTNLGGSGTTRIWTGGGADTLASDAANWSGSSVPYNGDDVIFDDTSVKDCDWDIDVPIHSIRMNSGYTGTVTVDSSLTISDDLIISDGKLITGNAIIFGNGASVYSPGTITIQ